MIPLYAEPGCWALPDTSARQWAFGSKCLAELPGTLGTLGAPGAPLIVRTGRTVDVPEALRGPHGVGAIFSREETGNLRICARDRAVRALARERGFAWTELQGSAVQRRSPGCDGWAKRREALVRAPVTEAPRVLAPMPGLDPGAIPTWRDLGLAPDPCHERQPGGRAHALRLLDSFLAVRGQGYRAEMSTPVAGAHACLRLSPHLALGTLSVREAAQALAARRSELPKGRDGWGVSLAGFSNRPACRDHFVQKPEDDPQIERRGMHPALDVLRPRERDSARRHAWMVGETGLASVNARARWLAAGGWLNLPMRAMVEAAASCHFWLDWRQTSMRSARMYADCEPGIHLTQTEMQSGTTGTDPACICNPVKQGHDQNPDGRFTRRWVPEFAAVPDRLPREPSLWEGAGRLAYSPRRIGVKATAAEAKSRLHTARQGEAFRVGAAQIVAWHGSRKPPETRRRRA